MMTNPISIDQIQAKFEALSPAQGEHWKLDSIFPERFHLSLDPNRNFTLFIEGSRESFGRIPILAGVEYRSDAQDLQSGRTFGALRISGPKASFASRAISHIGYEIAEKIAANPESSNSDLLLAIRWIMQVLGREPKVLSEQQQSGLIAECILATRLLSVGRVLGVSSSDVLSKWWGPMGGKRDFAASNIAIEVKSTALNSRTHHISSLNQLWPQSDDESVYLYSVGLRREATSSHSLPDYIDSVKAEIIDAAGNPDHVGLDLLTQSLDASGYDASHNDLYRSGSGYSLNTGMQPALYDVSSLDGLSIDSFKGNELPSMVRTVTYDLEITVKPLSPVLSKNAMESLVLAAALGA